MNPPPKPSPDFPLFAHTNGQWRKDVRINGKVKAFYFGAWADDPKGKLALVEWVNRRDAIKAGLDHLNLNAAPDPAAMTVAEMLKRFMQGKHDELLADKIGDDTFNDYVLAVNAFGKWVGPTAVAAKLTPDHFAAYRRELEVVRKLGVDRLATTIRYLRAAFNHAAGEGWVPAPTFGSKFAPPATDPDSKAAAAMKRGQDVDDSPVFEPAHVAWLLDNATPAFRAMILLALNCGVGPTDLARLRWRHIKGKRLSLRRKKNGIRREGYLWKRTREALERVKTLKHNRLAIAAEGDEALVFITRKREPYVRTVRVTDATGRVVKIKRSNAIAGTFGKLVKAAQAAGCIPKTKRLTFYSLRRTFRSHADNCPDSNAVRRTMGRLLDTVASDRRYVQAPFETARLRKVARTVYRRVFPKSQNVALNV